MDIGYIFMRANYRLFSIVSISFYFYGPMGLQLARLDLRIEMSGLEPVML